MSQIARAIDEHLRRISDAAMASGRAPGDISLVAVCKRQPIQRIIDAWDAGLQVFGENTVQGLRHTASAIHPREPQWHFVGRLQRNKVAQVLEYDALIHSVDRMSLAKAISKEALKKEIEAPVLIQVNLAEEQQKGGIPAGEAIAFATEVAKLPSIEVRGLMTLPPFGEESGKYFSDLAELSKELRQSLPHATELSMGMSGDFESAIKHGATIVRVGEGIFGARTS